MRHVAYLLLGLATGDIIVWLLCHREWSLYLAGVFVAAAIVIGLVEGWPRGGQA